MELKQKTYPDSYKTARRKNMSTEPKQTLQEPETNAAKQPDDKYTGYPDISKADTKTVVIISLVFVLVIFLLSVFVPR